MGWALHSQPLTTSFFYQNTQNIAFLLIPAESLSPPKESMSPGDTTEDDFSNDGFATMDELDEDSNSNFSLTKEESFEPTEKKKRGRPKKIHYEEEFVENEREVDLTPHCQTCEKVNKV